MAGRKRNGEKSNLNGKQGQMRPFVKVADFSPERKRELEIGRILMTADKDAFEQIEPAQEDMPLIARFTNSPHREVRKKAADVIVESTTIDVELDGLVPELVRALKTYPQDRLELMDALSVAYEQGGDISSVYKEIEDALDDESWEIRASAVDLFDIMARKGVSIERTLKKVVQLLSDGHGRVREAAMHTITMAARNGEIDYDSLPLMRDYLRYDMQIFKESAIDFFVNVILREDEVEGPSSTYDMIKNLVGDEDPLIAESADNILDLWAVRTLEKLLR